MKLKDYEIYIYNAIAKIKTHLLPNTQWQRINEYKCPINVTTNA